MLNLLPTANHRSGAPYHIMRWTSALVNRFTLHNHHWPLTVLRTLQIRSGFVWVYFQTSIEISKSSWLVATLVRRRQFETTRAFDVTQRFCFQEKEFACTISVAKCLPNVWEKAPFSFKVQIATSGMAGILLLSSKFHLVKRVLTL